MEKEMKSSTPSTPSWVDRLAMVPLSDSSTVTPPKTSTSIQINQGQGADGSDAISGSNQPLEFNIASLNVLAEGYLTPRSHHGLPESYANVAFDKVKRRKLLLDTLERFCSPSNSSSGSNSDDIMNTKWDIFALQELDLIGPDHQILPALESWGYQVVKTPADQRRDCCAIAFDASKFSLVEHEVVQFDDLATLQSNNADGNNGNGNESSAIGEGYNNIRPGKKPNSVSELTGMVRSFLRRNCAVLAHLKSIDTNQSFVVASVHLYWHPGYEYVKLCQAKYLLDKVAAFASAAKKDADTTTTESTTSRIPTVICGDMNSKPMSIVHKLFIQPHVDARTVAPWRYFWDKDNEDVYTEEEEKDAEESVDSGGDRKDGQDPIVEAETALSAASLAGDDAETKAAGGYMMVGLNADFTIAGHDAEEKTEGGYMMIGLSAEFTMYCGLIDDSIQDSYKDNKGKADIATHKIRHKMEWKSETPMTKLLNPEAVSGEKYDPEEGDVEASKHHSDTVDGKDIAESNVGAKSDYDKYIASRKINKHMTPQDYQHSTPPLPVKYMLDYTLNKFTRWLRILGMDATYETMEEEKERTRQGGKIAIFDHCKRENRTLLTTSYKLLLRKECPPGAYLLDPKSSADLERALPRLLRTHGIELAPCKFLTQCVICNGSILRVTSDEDKKSVFVDHGAPALVDSKDMEVFRCIKCRQGYWWDDRSSSSASRVFAQATKLFKLCLRGGVSLKDEHETDEKKRNITMGAFDFVDVAKERESAVAMEANGEISVIEWLREPKLSNPFQFKSAYAAPGNTGREVLPFTNVTQDFVGCLDYVFFEPLQFDLISRLKVPTSFRDMNLSGERQGHLIPSDIWPSDHIAVGARLRLKQNKTVDDTKVQETSESALDCEIKDGSNDKSADTAKPIAHPLRCPCGCVPNILSLFEMAELRKKHREQKKAEAAAKLSN